MEAYLEGRPMRGALKQVGPVLSLTVLKALLRRDPPHPTPPPSTRRDNPRFSFKAGGT